MPPVADRGPALCPASVHLRKRKRVIETNAVTSNLYVHMIYLSVPNIIKFIIKGAVQES